MPRKGIKKIEIDTYVNEKVWADFTPPTHWFTVCDTMLCHPEQREGSPQSQS